MTKWPQSAPVFEYLGEYFIGRPVWLGGDRYGFGVGHNALMSLDTGDVEAAAIVFNDELDWLRPMTKAARTLLAIARGRGA